MEFLVGPAYTYLFYQNRDVSKLQTDPWGALKPRNRTKHYDKSYRIYKILPHTKVTMTKLWASMLVTMDTGSICLQYFLNLTPENTCMLASHDDVFLFLIVFNLKKTRPPINEKSV